MPSGEAQRAAQRRRYAKYRTDPAFMEAKREAARRWYVRKREREQQRAALAEQAARETAEQVEVAHPSGVGSRCARCDGQIVEVYGELKCVQCSRSPERARAEQRHAA